MTNGLDAIQLRWRITKNHLNAGETQKAISLFAEIDELRGTQLRRYEAVAYLRLTQQENWWPHTHSVHSTAGK